MLFWTLVAFGLLTCGASLSTGFHCGRDRAYVTAMKSDLRNLVSAQELFIEEHHRYATDSEIRRTNDLFRSSTGVTVVIESADSQGWRARAMHSQLKGSCTIFVGVVAGKFEVPEGEPRCNVQFNRPRVTPEQFLFNISVDCWLFAFSVARRRRKRLEEEAIPDAAAPEDSVIRDQGVA